uniref:Uncharacterized protein n=1 Tax=Chromera velia CCMP2878 TaxID=1169474 RepID=A0A0G4G405_9ALVE|eukprot:Cvel_20182.t1-p1 / transcript=Cvel_20182.t1 / gene=Cvel_20182 / organism=Chromera_velia_CCMP2878 / gene_product=hypothetical protein / transcript_product=hypothetical protein / location=Cvel_scaffold1794:9883-10368(-) / protein_length=162 / sequence_SO=supercontig / SO=protein_coding / is_pseudo=false
MSIIHGEGASAIGGRSTESAHSAGLLQNFLEEGSLDSLLGGSAGVLSFLPSQREIPETGDGSLLGGVSVSNGTDEGLGEDRVQSGSNQTGESNRGLLAGAPQSAVQGGTSDIGSSQDSLDDWLGGSRAFGGGSVFLGSSVAGSVPVPLPSHYSATLAAPSQI